MRRVGKVVKYSVVAGLHSPERTPYVLHKHWKPQAGRVALCKARLWQMHYRGLRGVGIVAWVAPGSAPESLGSRCAGFLSFNSIGCAGWRSSTELDRVAADAFEMLPAAAAWRAVKARPPWRHGGTRMRGGGRHFCFIEVALFEHTPRRAWRFFRGEKGMYRASDLFSRSF